MKQNVFLLFVALFAGTLEAQKLNDHYLSAKLNPGYPHEVSRMVENLSNVKSAILETGIDSIKAYFGSFSQGSEDGCWASLYYNKRNNFSMFIPRASDSSEMLAEDIDFRFNHSFMISLKVLYNPATDEVFYQWMNKNGSSKRASFQKVDKLVRKNEPMPYFNVEALNGTSIALEDFRGKYLVINWWQTTCAPCITEMPGLNELVEKYKSRNDVQFIAIAWDDKAKVEKFLKKRDFKYQQTLADKETASIFGDLFPKHIIVDPEGIVTFYFEGGYAEIHHYIEQSLHSQLIKK